MNNKFDDMYYDCYAEKSKTGTINKIDEIHKKREPKVKELENKAKKLNNLLKKLDGEGREIVQRKYDKILNDIEELDRVDKKSNADSELREYELDFKKDKDTDGIKSVRKDRKIYYKQGDISKPKESDSHKLMKMMGYSTQESMTYSMSNKFDDMYYESKENFYDRINKTKKEKIDKMRKSFECAVDVIFEAYKENVINTDEVKMLLECTNIDTIIGYLDNTYYESLEDDLYEEGANLDIRAKIKESKKKLDNNLKEIRALIKKSNFDEANKLIDETKGIVSEVYREVENIDTTMGSAIFGLFTGFAPTWKENLIYIALGFAGGTLAASGATGNVPVVVPINFKDEKYIDRNKKEKKKFRNKLEKFNFYKKSSLKVLRQYNAQLDNVKSYLNKKKEKERNKLS